MCMTKDLYRYIYLLFIFIYVKQDRPQTAAGAGIDKGNLKALFHAVQSHQFNEWFSIQLLDLITPHGLKIEKKRLHS